MPASPVFSAWDDMRIVMKCTASIWAASAASASLRGCTLLMKFRAALSSVSLGCHALRSSFQFCPQSERSWSMNTATVDGERVPKASWICSDHTS
ncbi:hypothetical protein BRX43_03190 [Sphingomonas sp. S-NIH.Pt15_0812]|nr:hypothetical protein BRX43_03190 [Sphingomonas sp. S-NIH.Pt15_0812]